MDTSIAIGMMGLALLAILAWRVSAKRRHLAAMRVHEARLAELERILGQDGAR